MEKEHYKTVYDIGEEIIYTESVEEAKLLVARNRGYFLIESSSGKPQENEFVKVIPLYRNGEQIMKQYCVFWKKSNDKEQYDMFANLLKRQFQK